MTNALLIVLALLPLVEQKLALRVADEYQLTNEQTVLLCCIRKVENGSIEKHFEFGIGETDKNHPARKSSLAQWRWAAGTIKKRYDGNLTKLAKRWCSLNPVEWEKNVGFWLKKRKSHRERKGRKHV